MNILSPPKVAALTVILPDELIIEVLSFFPVKSLMQMKCVCMSWKTLISDSIFVKLHLKKQSTRNFALLHGENNCKVPSPSVVTISGNYLLESMSLSNSISLSDEYRFKFFCKIVGSCNGLICLQSLNQLYLWNPATRTNSKPLYPHHMIHISLYNMYNKYWLAFGYDNSTDTYKVVVLSFKMGVPPQLNKVRPTVRVLTFGDDIWRDIQSFPVVVIYPRFGITYSDEQSGVYLNNSVNWYVRCQYYCYLKNITSERFEIISLDLGTETYTQFLLPRCWEVPLDQDPTLCVLMDCLCFSYTFNKSYFVLWQMKKFGVEESWTQFLKIRNLNDQVQIYGINFYRLTPLCFSKNGDILIFAINRSGDAIFYDWRNIRVERVVNTNISMLYTAKGYFESLVSTS